MPQFQFKIKGYLNETGEYSELHTTESGTILQFIIQHWFNETLPNNLDIILIQNEAGDQLIIDHLKRDVFDYYYIEKSATRIYYHKKTDIQFMFFVLECFFNNLKEDLRHNFTASNDDWRFILGDYRGKNFNYAVTNKRLLNNLDSLILPAFGMISSFIVSFFTSFMVMIFGFTFSFLYGLGMFSTVKRVRRYYADNKDIELKFSRGDEFLHIKKGTWSRSIPKTDIRNIIKYIPPQDRGSMLTEYYTEIEFLNGNVLNVTCLLIAQDEIELKFANDLVPIEIKIMGKGIIERPTNLDKYFSAIKPIANS